MKRLTLYLSYICLSLSPCKFPERNPYDIAPMNAHMSMTQ